MKTIKYRIVRCVKPGTQGLLNARVWFEAKYKRLIGWTPLYTIQREGDEWYRRVDQFDTYGEAEDACRAHAAADSRVIKTLEAELDL